MIETPLKGDFRQKHNQIQTHT